MGLLIAAGALTGASHLDGRLWALAWIGVALTAGLAQRAIPTRWLIAGLVAGGLVGDWTAHPWHVDGLGRYMPGGGSQVWLWLVPFTLAWGLPQHLPLAASAWLGRRFGLPAAVWLPVGWWAGEALWDATIGLSHGAWLYAQWQVPWVLRAVGLLGWDVTMLVGLAMAAAAGEAIARRSWRPALPLGLGLCGALLLPPLPAGNPAALAGWGAVHMSSYAKAPRQAPAGVSWLVWPEQFSGRRPRLGEGPGNGVRIAPPFRTGTTHHLAGLIVRSPLGTHNAAVALSPDGEVLEARAKRRLFPLSERPVGWLSLPGLPHYVPGQKAPVLHLGGRCVTALVCVEELDRELVAWGRREGAELVAILSDDWGLGASPVAHQQVLATAVFRAVEAGVPVVRASLHGQAAIVGPDGRVWAVSRAGSDGVLTVERAWPKIDR